MLLKVNKEPSPLKKLLPKGACLPEDIRKHEYMTKLIASPLSHQRILPMQSQFASFVVIKKQPQSGQPIYQMFFHPTRQFLLSAQQQSMSIGCNYVVCTTELPSKNRGFVGKLRGNFQGDQFQVYDCGDNPGKIRDRPRKHLGFIQKQESSMWSGNKDDVKLNFFVPKPHDIKSEIQGVSQFQPLDFVCSDKNKAPLSSDPNRSGNTETLTHKEGFANLAYHRTFILRSSLNAETLIIRQKSSTYYELQIGCPLTCFQGFAYLLSLLEIFSL